MTKVFQGLPIMTWTRRELQHEKAYSIAITGYFLATSTRFCEISRSISSRISEPTESISERVRVEIDPRNRLKIHLKWCPGGAWGGPRSFPPGRRSRPIFRPNQKSMKAWKDSRTLPGRLGRFPGIQRAVKIDQIWAFFSKSVFQPQIFCGFLSALQVFEISAQFVIGFSL